MGVIVDYAIAEFCKCHLCRIAWNMQRHKGQGATPGGVGLSAQNFICNIGSIDNMCYVCCKKFIYTNKGPIGKFHFLL